VKASASSKGPRSEALGAGCWSAQPRTAGPSAHFSPQPATVRYPFRRVTEIAHLTDASVAYEISGGGDPLVWSHGLASCRDGDRDVIDALSEHFTVLSYDARGHGDSPPVTDERFYTYPAMGRDLRELLDHVGWPSTILAGSSMGAGATFRVAIEDPARCRALVMVRPGSAGGAAPERLQMLFRLGAAAIRSGGLDGAIEFLLSIPQAREDLEKNPGRLEALKKDWGRHEPLSIAAALEGIPGSPPLTPDLDVSRLVAPVMVIPGNDPIHTIEAGTACAASIPGAFLAPSFNGLPRDEEVKILVERIRGFVDRGEI
jgi:3-oxoadipate enol-lactonase